MRGGVSSSVVRVVAVAALMPFFAMPVAAESLWQALKNTQMTNSRLNADRSRHAAEGEKTAMARAGYFPQVNANADAGYARSGFNGAINTLPRGFGISATQALFNPRLGPENNKAQSDVEAAMAMLVSSEQQSLLDATQAFLSVVRERRILTLRQQALGTMRQMQAQATERHKAGDITRTSVDQTRARVAEVDADLAQSVADRADAEAMYKMVIGLEAKNPTMPSLGAVLLPKSLGEAVTIAENENPKIAAALHASRSAQSAIDVAKAGHLPVLGVEGSYRQGYEDDNQIGRAGQNAAVKLKLSVPIFDGGLTSAQVRQAEQTSLQRDFEAEDMRKNVRRAVESAFNQHRGAVLRRAASQRRVAANIAALHGLEIEFNAGNTPLYTLLDGRRELVNSQVALERANYDVAMTTFLLLAGMGRFDLERILLVHGDNVVSAFGRSRKARSAGDMEPRTTGAVKEKASRDMREAVDYASGTPLVSDMPDNETLAGDGQNISAEKPRGLLPFLFGGSRRNGAARAETPLQDRN